MQRLRTATVIVVVLMIGGLVMVGFSYLYLAAHVGVWADDHKAAISASSQPYLKEDVLIAGMIMTQARLRFQAARLAASARPVVHRRAPHRRHRRPAYLGTVEQGRA